MWSNSNLQWFWFSRLVTDIKDFVQLDHTWNSQFGFGFDLTLLYFYPWFINWDLERLLEVLMAPWSLGLGALLLFIYNLLAEMNAIQHGLQFAWQQGAWTGSERVLESFVGVMLVISIRLSCISLCSVFISERLSSDKMHHLKLDCNIWNWYLKCA